MDEKKKEYNVTVLSRDEVTTYPKLGEAVVTILTTYVGANLPPHTVRIPKERWTLEKEKVIIRASIEDRLTRKPVSYRV